MPAKKYHTEEERLEARRASAKRFYENHKHDEAFKERQRLSTQKFNESHRELVALRSKQYYWANAKYRNQKLDRSSERYSTDEEFKNRVMTAARQRYWDRRAVELEAEVATEVAAKAADP
jgi:hypothetical protein